MSATRRMPGVGKLLVRGAVGGVVAGIVFAVLNMWYASSTGAPATMPLHAISTIVLGDSAMADGSTVPAVGAIVHMVLSAGFGMAVALIVARLRSDATVMMASTAFGALLFVLNFLILAPLVFTTFTNPNKPFELVVHVVFGTLVGFAFVGAEGSAGRRQAAETERRGVA